MEHAVIDGASEVFCQVPSCEEDDSRVILQVFVALINHRLDGFRGGIEEREENIVSKHVLKLSVVL